jgi:ankyrin repeat protein
MGNNQVAIKTKPKYGFGFEQTELRDFVNASNEGRLLDAEHILTAIAKHNPYILKSKTTTGNTALHWAPTKKSVDLLVDMGVSVDESDMCKDTPLHYACSRGHVDVVLALLDHGASLSVQNISKLSPLYHACRGKIFSRSGHLDLVKVLLHEKHLSGSDPWDYNGLGFSPFARACVNGDLPLAKEFYTKCNPNDLWRRFYFPETGYDMPRPVHYSSKFGTIEVYEWLRRLMVRQQVLGLCHHRNHTRQTIQRLPKELLNLVGVLLFQNFQAFHLNEML